MKITHILSTLIIIFSLAACSNTRIPVPTGEIPSQGTVVGTEEQYGHKVFQQLAQKFPIDTDDNRILRVRAVVDRLTKVRNNDQNIWHVHLFKDDSFANAAATRGNYIFVWSGLVNTVDDDAELATILAHEIGHVLAGHTKPNPAEEVNKMLAQLAGSTAQRVMRSVGDPMVAGLATLGGLLARELIKAIAVNPNSQEVELEADELGLFVMAEAGYDPRKALTFWDRVKNDPRFGNSPVQFLSSHPSSSERLEALKAVLPQAQARYHGDHGGGSNNHGNDGNTFILDVDDSQNNSFVVDQP